MTDETPETPTPDAAQPVAQAVREAVESGKDISGEVRQIVVDLFRGKQSTVASARKGHSGNG